MAHHTPEYATLRAALRSAGWAIREVDGCVNWTDALPADHASWLAERPSRVRNTLRRRGRRFFAQPGARIEIVCAGDALDRAMAAYADVYARSWKPPEPDAEFMPELARQLASAGSLRLGLAWIGDRPVAAHLWAVRRGVAFVYKLAYDPVAADLSAGSLLFSELVRHAMENDRATRLDFLSGDDRYKADWTRVRGRKRTLLGFDARRPIGLAALLRHDMRAVRDRLAAR